MEPHGKGLKHGGGVTPNMHETMQLLSYMLFSKVARKHPDRMNIKEINENHRKRMDPIGNHRNPMEISIKWQQGHAKYLYKTCILGSFSSRGPGDTSKFMKIIENT